jgi:hypothetical protein
MGGGTSAGQLVLIPALSWLVVTVGWREATVIVALTAFAMIVPVLAFMRDAPGDLGLLPYGATTPTAAGANTPSGFRETLGRAVRVPEFWLLAGSFFVCGATSVGIIGTHFIPHAEDHGIREVTAAGALAILGALMALRIDRTPLPEALLAPAAAAG